MYFFLIWMTELLPLHSTEKDDLEEIKSELGNISEQLQTLLAKPREELRPLRDKGKSLKVTNAFIGYLTNRPQFSPYIVCRLFLLPCWITLIFQIKALL